MTDKRFCPFCNRELQEITTSNPLGLGRIEMAVCKNCMDNGVLHIMPTWDWDEFIKTVDALNEAKKYLMNIAYLNMSEHGIGSESMMIDWCKTVANTCLKEIEKIKGEQK